MILIRSYKSSLGEMTLASEGDALVGLWFKGQHCLSPYLLGLQDRQEEGDAPILDQVRRWLDTYFTGRQPDFMPPVRLSGTPFQMLVWRLLMGIPYGQVVTYGELANEAAKCMGKPSMSSQAVGQAVGRNPVAILVPCHRVVAAGGRMGGYAAGVDRKRRLLQLENTSGDCRHSEPLVPLAASASYHLDFE